MAKRKRSSAPVRRRRRQRGSGFFSNLVDGWKSGFKQTNQFVKDNRIQSRIIKLLPVPGADLAGDLVAHAGYGRKRMRGGYAPITLMGGRKMRGSGLFGSLGGLVDNFV